MTPGLRLAVAAAAALLVVSAALPASAQPGATPRMPVRTRPPAPQVQLTPKERELLLQGEITPGQHVGGGLVAIFFGLGIGHAVQGRYGDKGWIFTVGEIGSGLAVVIGAGGCIEDDGSCSLAIGGLIGMGVFRVWEIIDALAAPPSHNRKVREIRRRLDGPPRRRWAGFAAPAASGDGAVGGIELRF